MKSMWSKIIWQQFGAAIDMLENAIRACPDDLWADSSGRHQFWYIAYHTLFFLEFYLSGREEGFVPLAPFTLSELDPSGLMPKRTYSKEELLTYLEYGRKKCRQTIESMTDEMANEQCGFNKPGITVAGLHLSNMRHVQHHAAQLNLILRQKIDSAPLWVSKAKG